MGQKEKSIGERRGWETGKTTVRERNILSDDAKKTTQKKYRADGVAIMITRSCVGWWDAIAPK